MEDAGPPRDRHACLVLRLDLPDPGANHLLRLLHPVFIYREVLGLGFLSRREPALGRALLHGYPADGYWVQQLL